MIRFSEDPTHDHSPMKSFWSAYFIAMVWSVYLIGMGLKLLFYFFLHPWHALIKDMKTASKICCVSQTETQKPMKLVDVLIQKGKRISTNEFPLKAMDTDGAEIQEQGSTFLLVFKTLYFYIN